MIESKEKIIEKEKINKKNEIKNSEIQRNEEKKPTLNLSDIPNIINNETQYYEQFKNNISSNFPIDYHSLTNGFLNEIKLKNSFINEPISHNKEESRSSLEEIQVLLKTIIKENKNKSIGKKEKKQKIHSNKKKNISNESSIKNKNKDKDKDNNKNKELIINEINKHKHYSSKKKDFNFDSDEEQKPDKNKKVKIKFRKSEIIRPFKKDGMVVGDDTKKGIKRKSLFSLQTRSPEKINKNEIYNKFFAKKMSFESKNEKRNEDKIYINIENKEELVITVNTTQETVKNYYEYMQDCFEIIDLYFNKSIKLQSGDPVNFHFKENKKIVIFELESTLVSCFWGNVPNEINNTLGINVRPHLKSSLDLIKKDYNIVIYSSSNRIYVDKILDFLDPEHIYFNYRLYQENCYKFTINDKIYYTKNLNIFKNIANLKDIIIVDCSVLGFGFFLDNGIPIIPFYDYKEDVELKILSYYLVSISSNYYLRQALKRDMKLNDYLELAKKKNEKNNISPDKNEEYEKDIKKSKKSKEINEKYIKSSNASPEMIKRKMKKENKTCKNNNYIHIFKGSSDSEEDKKSIDNKHKNHDKTKKNKKEKDKDKMRPRKDRYFSTKLIKKKNRKYTANENELNRNNMNIKSPKKTSPENMFRNSGKKNNDKNKKFINED